MEEFHGCKVALFQDDKILVFLRDDLPEIESPGMWDLPGGGREGLESPEQCVLRELQEEFGLRFGEERLTYKRQYFREYQGRTAYFFAGQISQAEIDAIEFGDEGQYWKLMKIESYLVDPKSVPRHVQRLKHYLEAEADGAG